MILSALLTSVGINLGLCLLFFTLYSILSKWPSLVNVYASRLVSEEGAQQTSHFYERLLPSAGWVKRAWQPSEDELLSTLGLDAVVFMRIIIFSLRIFTFAGIVGICFLLPINFLGDQLSIDASDLASTSLDSFSISNANDGSNWLYVHFCATYIFTGLVCYLLYYEYKYITAKRVAYFMSSKPQPHQFTILVRGIPISSEKSLSESVESFFREYHPSTYLSHLVVHRTGKLHNIIRDATAHSKRLLHLKSQSNSRQKYTRDGFLGLFGKRVDIVDHYEKKLEDLEDTARLEQSSLAGEEVPAAFVSFNSRYGAASALHIPQAENPVEWVTEQAPEPQDIHWSFFSISFLKRLICKLLVFFACIVLTILFLIPVAIAQGLTNLAQLEAWFPFLESILTITVVSQLITGYLPSLILHLFLSTIPPIMKFLSSIEGYISHSGIIKSACTKMLWFTIWNVFFANALSGSVLYRLDILLEPKEIVTVLAEAVPGQASFFIAYVVTSGWTSLSSELFRLIPLIRSCIRRVFSRKNVEFKVPSMPYHSAIPAILLFELFGITYFILAPLILPFLLVYYCLGYLIYRNQLLSVYVTKYETAGKFWPIVHNSTMFSLVLMHIIAFGIFGVKSLPIAAGLIIPLPILTLLFNLYCQKRFSPMFKAYAAESLIKKDREDHNDPAISDFLEKLVTAYRDPALKPIQYSEGIDNSPLLQEAEVST